MEAVYWGNFGNSSAKQGPWVMADMEDGVWAGKDGDGWHGPGTPQPIEAVREAADARHCESTATASPLPPHHYRLTTTAYYGRTSSPRCSREGRAASACAVATHRSYEPCRPVLLL